jgi:serine/threonine protein kinase
MSTAGAEYCPFIVSLYDAYKHQGQLRLVMEYMNGGSLQVLFLYLFFIFNLKKEELMRMRRVWSGC